MYPREPLWNAPDLIENLISTRLLIDFDIQLTTNHICIVVVVDDDDFKMNNTWMNKNTKTFFRKSDCLTAVVMYACFRA